MSGCGRCAAQSRFWRLKDALDELQALDLLQCFGDAVDEEAVPTYRTVIAKPMDFGTMRATNPNPNPNPARAILHLEVGRDGVRAGR